MDFPSVISLISLVVGVVSIVLGIVAIWSSTQSERRSRENYDRTNALLSDIGKKAAVIEGSVNSTQEKLVDTVTAIAKPKEETQDDKMKNMIMQAVMGNPKLLGQMMQMVQQNDPQSTRGRNTTKSQR